MYLLVKVPLITPKTKRAGHDPITGLDQYLLNGHRIYLKGFVKLRAMAKTDMKSVGKNFEKVSGRRMSVERNSSMGVAICLVAEILEKFSRI
jgi:hypothetical protein